MRFQTGMSELPPAARRFVVFVGVNLICWQILVGTVLVLLARHIDMPPRWVGYLIAAMPLTMPLVIFTAPLVERFGPRRLVMIVWVVRYSVASIVFLMPWAIAARGAPGGWVVLSVATLGFCLARAFGVGGWFPWICEVVPEEKRGLYFGLEAAAMQIVNIALTFSVGLFLGDEPTLARFLVIDGVAIAVGFLSLLFIVGIPGGGRLPPASGLGGGLRAYGAVLRNRSYLLYLVMISLGMIAVGAMMAALPLYLRDVLEYSERRIMFVICFGGVGAALATRYWGRFADRHGSGPALSLILIGLGVALLAWLLLTPENPWTDWAVWPVVFLQSIHFSAFMACGARGMLARAPERGRVLYTNLYVVFWAMGHGLSPIAACYLIDLYGMTGFRICFAFCALVALGASIPFERLREEGQVPAPYAWSLLRASQPLRTAARIVWITAGLHESARPDQDESPRSDEDDAVPKG